MAKDHAMIGKPAPAIELPSVPKGDLYKVPFGEKPIALFFVSPLVTVDRQEAELTILILSFTIAPYGPFQFPKAFTSGCVKEACSFRDAKADNITFKRHPDLEVVGISGDDTTKQTAFADQHKLPYPIVSDTGNKVRQAYKVDSFMFGLAPGRTTFFIDEKGIVRGACADFTDASAHAKFVEKMLVDREKA